MDKVGCNHLVIAGLLESTNYAKADFLSMHLEQHLQFTIDRQGKLKSQWDEYYQNTLVPLEITSPEIEKGETVVYTREGRVIGNFDDFKDWCKTKYEVDIDYDEERMNEISKVHVERAQNAIDDANTQDFDSKVDKVLEQREKRLSKMNKILDTHKEVCANVNIAIEELNEYANIIQPHIDALYALHHYPVPEEHPEEEEQPSEQPNNEEEEKEGEEKGENDGETETETETTNDETEKPSEIAQEEEPEISPEDGENEEKPPNEEEEEKQEKPVEEEEEPEPDPESLEVQAKIQETLKWPTLEKCAEICEKMKDAEIGLQEFVDQIKAKAEDCNVQIKEEKFRWKKLEVSMLELKEQLTVAVNMLKISVLSAEELQMKAVQTEIDNYDNFVIPNVEKEILDAAAIKFAATFQFA